MPVEISPMLACGVWNDDRLHGHKLRQRPPVLMSDGHGSNGNRHIYWDREWPITFGPESAIIAQMGTSWTWEGIEPRGGGPRHSEGANWGFLCFCCPKTHLETHEKWMQRYGKKTFSMLWKARFKIADLLGTQIKKLWTWIAMKWNRQWVQMESGI